MVDMLHCFSPVKVNVPMLGAFGPCGGSQALIGSNSYDFRDHVSWAAVGRNSGLMVIFSGFPGFTYHFISVPGLTSNGSRPGNIFADSFVRNRSSFQTQGHPEINLGRDGLIL